MSKTITISKNQATQWGWTVDAAAVVYEPDAIKERLSQLHLPCYIITDGDQIGMASQAQLGGNGLPVIAYSAPTTAADLGAESFKKAHNVRYAYHCGAMANGIASENMVIALGKAGIICSFGAAGLVKSRVEEAIHRIQAELPNGPYAFNLIHSPSEPALEEANVNLFLEHGVKTVEASAFLALTASIVQYRLSGLEKATDGSVIMNNRVIAKVSRTEVASKFMEPAPEKFVTKLLEDGLISAEQAELSQRVPMADDITAEADSGGHTDKRPFITLLPTIINLRDEIQAKYQYATQVRVGVGGGIGTPSSALAAFIMGASYIVTGSINQACTQAGASEHTRKILAEAAVTDVAMAPAADMFEMGVKLQVLKRGTLFPMRAQKLYDIYSQYDSIEAIPADERQKIEKQIFRANLDDIWTGCIEFFNERDPQQIQRAQNNPKRKMALIFRWYLGLSSRWSNTGEPGREMDYQIWAGPSMGAFNAWTQGTYLEEYQNRDAVDVAEHMLRGAAYLYRIQQLKSQGVDFPVELSQYKPLQKLI